MLFLTFNPKNWKRRTLENRSDWSINEKGDRYPNQRPVVNQIKPKGRKRKEARDRLLCQARKQSSKY